MHITPTTNSSRQALRHDERAADPFPATKPSSNDVFRVMSLRTGTPTLFCNKQAVKGGLRISYPKQNSSCTEPDANYASFSLTENGD
ncbi:hypothetical protein BKA58DRAFT_375317 [Alternaria rosae]|uniref:uncharacterized protein n=1 Tax=Alternaria rosae TaxID=1187941 RepID=UPI001E8DD248|nr:uncharacterized protein BKA58DRAFT_395526 [Alternaria rosae]XP_046028340.1 uncharacterized protein BKA58DRAFT_375317 [Alternaria rosae]KAH6842160.1 hypothetical protein BKA58DRAFT_395526 [Alternaria rosae]KAH6877512.1 hypothetical protein BKA58DRAFT_375317 [Alternaria rosae]